MKKIILGVAGGLVVVVIVAALLVAMNLNRLVKAALETQGSKLAKVSIKVEKVNLSVLSGKGEVTGLVIGNPEGFKSPEAFRVQHASLEINPRSVFSDKVIIRSVVVRAPEITLEGDLTKNNLSRIAANLQESVNSAPATPSASKGQPAQDGAGKKLQLDEFVLTDGKVNLVQTAVGKSGISAPMPRLELKALGQGPEGITASELASKVLGSVCVEAVKAGLGGLTKGVMDQGVDKLKGLFKK